ncbi:tetratricopeptide repeat protein [Omnitrophica bacterium]|nr:tetratricopeptide repeat protein [Candidatus Omnitrophota bacterium]
MSFYVNYQMDGLNTFYYHTTNMVIHSIASIAVFLLARHLFLEHKKSKSVRNETEPASRNDETILAFFTAALFAAHPIQTQAVSYLAQRDTSLAGMFYLAAMFFYVQSAKSKAIGFRVASWICFILSIYSKLIAVSLPLAILGYEVCFGAHKERRLLTISKRVLPYILILLVLVALNFAYAAQGAKAMGGLIEPEKGLTHSRLDYLATQFSVICTYVRLMFVPYGQTLDYDYPIQSAFMNIRVLLPLFALISLWGGAVLLWKKNRVMSFGILWFFITVSIESSFIPLSDVINEHRLYLPMFGFSLLIAMALFGFLKNRKVYQLIMISIIILCAILTYRRNQLWASEPLFWQDVIRKAPAKVRPVVNLADYYEDHGEFHEAIKYALKAVEIDPGIPQAYDILGLCYAKTGDKKKAIGYFKKAIEIDRHYVKAYNNLAVIYDQMGDLKKEIELYRQAIKIDPEYLQGYTNLGILYGKTGDYQKARDNLEKAQRLNPDDKNTLYNLGVVYGKLGEFKKAEGQIDKLSRFDLSQAEKLKSIIEKNKRAAISKNPSGNKK